MVLSPSWFNNTLQSVFCLVYLEESKQGEAWTDSTVNDLVAGREWCRGREIEREKGAGQNGKKLRRSERVSVYVCMCVSKRASERRNVRGLCTLPFPLAVTDGIMWSGHCHLSACLLHNPLCCASLTEEPQSRRTWPSVSKFLKAKRTFQGSYWATDSEEIWSLYWMPSRKKVRGDLLVFWGSRAGVSWHLVTSVLWDYCSELQP